MVNISAITLDESLSGITASRSTLLRFSGDFQSEMRNIIRSLADPTADLTVGQYHFASDQKSSVAATYAINDQQSRIEYAFNVLLDTYKFNQTLENRLNNSVTG